MSLPKPFESAERVAFVVLSAAVIGFYIFMRAPVFDPPSYLDPWFYTAMFVNYHFLLTAFPHAYYSSRLPWIIPGIVANRLFSPVPAFFVLHTLFFLGGGLFAFLLFRRFFGTRVALLGYAALMLTPLYYDAYSNDYPDGAIIAYLFAGAYFGLGAWRSRRRLLRFVTAGFFLAAAICTNLFASIFVAGLVLIYLAVFHVEPRFVRRLGGDLLGVLVGACVLLVGCGLFSRHSGGSFWFFMSSVREAQTIDTGAEKAHGYGWMKSEAQLLLPIIAVCSLLVMAVMARRLMRRWRDEAAVRFAIGSGCFLAFTFGVVAIWEFAKSGNFLETPYYFSLFNTGIAMVVTSCIYFLTHELIERVPSKRFAGFAAVAACCTAFPTLAFFRLELWRFGERPAFVTLVLGVALITMAVVCGLGFTRRRGLIAVPAAVLLLMFTANFAAASGYVTLSVFGTTPSTYGERRQTLAVAMQLIRFMKQYGLQDPASGLPTTTAIPGFWSNPYKDGNLIGIESTYFWADSWVGLNMPRVDPEMKAILNSRTPTVLILLCSSRDCSHAQKALTGAGYPNSLIASRLLSSGHEQVWVRGLVLKKFTSIQPSS